MNVSTRCSSYGIILTLVVDAAIALRSFDFFDHLASLVDDNAIVGDDMGTIGDLGDLSDLTDLEDDNGVLFSL